MDSFPHVVEMNKRMIAPLPSEVRAQERADTLAGFVKGAAVLALCAGIMLTGLAIAWKVFSWAWS